MPAIHPTALISPDTTLADDVVIGPFVVIDGPVAVGPGCRIEAHVRLVGPLTLGANNAVGTGSVFGGAPQHLGYKGEPTAVLIGDGNTFREYVTVHRGMPVGVGPGTGTTVIGNNNFFMAGAHVAHDCVVGDHNILANAALLAGHVVVGDRSLISGNSAVHQFCRVGRLAMLAGVSATTKDIPPFFVMRGVNRVCGVNLVGMRRAGLPAAEIQGVRRTFKYIYREGLTVAAGVLRAHAELGHLPAVRELVEFIRASKRGICGPSHYDHNAEDMAA